MSDANAPDDNAPTPRRSSRPRKPAVRATGYDDSDDDDDDDEAMIRGAIAPEPKRQRLSSSSSRRSGARASWADDGVTLRLRFHNLLTASEAAGASPAGAGSLKLRFNVGGGTTLVPPDTSGLKLKIKAPSLSNVAAQVDTSAFSIDDLVVESDALNRILTNLLHNLRAKDGEGLFAYPVDRNEYPQYYQLVTNPMDFQTMSNRLESGLYVSIAHLGDDFATITNNAITFNEDGSYYNKAAKNLARLGKTLFERARRDLQNASIPRTMVPPAAMASVVDLRAALDLAPEKKIVQNFSNTAKYELDVLDPAFVIDPAKPPKCRMCRSTEVTDITGNFLPYPFVAGAVRRIWLHTNCARTAPEVAFDGANFYNAMKATARSAGLKCSVCKQKGAPIGCFVERCSQSFHLPCTGVPVEHFLNRTPFFCEAHLNSKKAAAILREEAERKERAKLSRRYSDVLENIVRDTEAQEAASQAAAAPANAASTAAAATNSPAASSPRSSSRSRSRSRSTWSPSKGADDSTSVGRFNLPPAPHNAFSSVAPKSLMDLVDSAGIAIDVPDVPREELIARKKRSERKREKKKKKKKKTRTKSKKKKKKRKGKHKRTRMEKVVTIVRAPKGMDDPTVQMVYVDNELEPAPTPLVPYKQLVGRPQSRHAFAPDRNSVNATLTVEQSAVVRAPEMDAFMRDWQPESLERFLCGETTGDSPHDALLTDPLAAYRDATPPQGPVTRDDVEGLRRLAGEGIDVSFVDDILAEMAVDARLRNGSRALASTLGRKRETDILGTSGTLDDTDQQALATVYKNLFHVVRKARPSVAMPARKGQP